MQHELYNASALRAICIISGKAAGVEFFFNVLMVELILDLDFLGRSRCCLCGGRLFFALGGRLTSFAFLCGGSKALRCFLWRILLRWSRWFPRKLRLLLQSRLSKSPNQNSRRPPAQPSGRMVFLRTFFHVIAHDFYIVFRPFVISFLMARET